MMSTAERKRNNLAKMFLPSFNAEMKKYDELYQMYCNDGYSKELCDMYADSFVDTVKKPLTDDIMQTAMLYDKIHDLKNVRFYLEMLNERKLTDDQKFRWCVETLKNKSQLEDAQDVQNFRTQHIDFMQNYASRPESKADMNISLALTDCASKQYNDAFKLLGFGYRPKDKNDEKLLDIFTAIVYVYSFSTNNEAIKSAIKKAQDCLDYFSRFDFGWRKNYYIRRIRDASNGII